MYDNHVPAISAAMRANPDTFVRGALFAILSARQHIVTVPDQLQDVEQLGLSSPSLFSWKGNSYRYLRDNGEELWREVTAAGTVGEAMRALCKVPGLGIVKAGFVAQLLGFDVACLDTRNIVRDGRNPRAYRSDGEQRKSTAAFSRKIDRYLADVGGRAREYWDAWCEDVAAVYNLTAMEISELHLAIIGDAQETAFSVGPDNSSDIPF